MSTTYFSVLKSYSELETIVRKHSKKLREAKINCKNYLKSSDDLYFKKLLVIIEQLRSDRKIIRKNVETILNLKIDGSIDFKELKIILDLLDYIYALLDYLKLVDLNYEKFIFRKLMKLSKTKPFSDYRESFEKDLNDVKELSLILGNVLSKIKFYVSNMLKNIDSDEYINEYLKNSSFTLTFSKQ